MFKTRLFTLTIFSILIHSLSFAQIKGRVTNIDGHPIPSTTVSVENTYNATSTNSNGEFELKNVSSNSCVLLFKNLGYSVKKVSWNKSSSPSYIHIILDSQELEIEEVIIKSNHNPADRIVKNAIANKNKNSKIFDQFEADFYSKGSMTLLKVPKRILGLKIDSAELEKEKAGSDILYLSETFSKIKVDKPNKMSERIIASKVSGDNKGLSFNRADDTDFNFYKNYINLNNTNLISPLADQAFSYYTYQLISTFQEENQTIFKIKILPRRSAEPVMDGYMYIVDDSWQLYGIDVFTLGKRANFPIIDSLFIKQQYTYNNKDKHWVKQLQALDVKAGILGINFKGNFTHSLSNYNFQPNFDKNTFSRVITEFDKDVNTKTDSFWDAQRQAPLTIEEIKDYNIKDSIALVRNNPVYIDSVDKARSKFKITDILTSYHYQNSVKKIYLDYSSPLKLDKISFNTVQGWNLKAELRARLGSITGKKLTQASVLFNYGFSDHHLYTIGKISHRFNKTNYAQLSLSAGNQVEQFNANMPITPFVNMISSLFFKDNYMKLYGQQFIAVNYNQYVHPDIKIYGNINYQNRTNLYNNSSYSFTDKSKDYLSNNPLDPLTPNSDAFINHDILKARISVDLFFKTKIEKQPEEIVYFHSLKLPRVTLNYTNALYASHSGYTYQEANASMRQNISFGNKGTLGYNVQAGTFINADDISFIDYKHFNGNRTHVSANKPYLNSYLLLPYYSHSTNKSYVELHTEHTFQGYLLNKIPLVSALNWNTNIGYHLLASANRKPYHEFTVGFGNIGWSKYRFLRVDYVHTKNGNMSPNGIVVGISLLNMFQ